MRRALCVLCCIAASAFAASPASASMIGASAGCAMVPGQIWSCDQPTAVVGAGNEFELVLGQQGTFFEVDLGALTVDLRYVFAGSLQMGAGEVVTLSDLLPLNEVITGVSLQTFGQVNAFDLSDITFGERSLTIVLNGSSWDPGSSARLSIDTSTVPEPATVVLLSLGAAGFAAAVRRRNRLV